jgi:hypothetical protein
MTDCAGEKARGSDFRIRLLGSIAALDAFDKAGAPGDISSDARKPDDEPLSLLRPLMERMRRSLSVKRISWAAKHGTQIADRTVCGRIEWDGSEDDPNTSARYRRSRSICGARRLDCMLMTSRAGSYA